MLYAYKIQEPWILIIEPPCIRDNPETVTDALWERINPN